MIHSEKFIIVLPNKHKNRESGFTLVELMIAMTAGVLVMAAVMTSFISQHRSYLAQDDVVEMQQNGRVAMDMFTREIRIAGFDPTGIAGAGINTANQGQLSFTQDITDNAGTGPSDGDFLDAGERVDFGFSLADDAGRDGIPDADIDGDGVPDPTSLGRQTGGAGGYQPIADNIQAIEFYYTLANGAQTQTPAAGQLANIRSVQISILARARQADPNFFNNMTYTPASGVIWDLNGAAAGNAPNDNFRRRLLITTINCRNLGL